MVYWQFSGRSGAWPHASSRVLDRADALRLQVLAGVRVVWIAAMQAD